MIRTLSDFDLKSRRVLLRVDYNLPIKSGKILDDYRIKASLPTLRQLFACGASQIIIISHLGRPAAFEPEFSLLQVARHLQSLLPEFSVEFSPWLFGEKLEQHLAKLPDRSVLVLENLRFFAEEEALDLDFANSIINSVRPNLFVQDGFGVLHRAHSSTVLLPKLLPSCAGLLVQQEIVNLSKFNSQPERPLLAIIGGAKIKDKQPLIDHFLEFADQIVVAGKIAADGYSASNPKIYVAEDFKLSEDQKLDIGPVSLTKIHQFIKQAKTIIWNGTLGQVENPDFAKSSISLAQAISKSGCDSLICGGDTVGFIQNLQKIYPLKFSALSTGGGASLEFLLGRELPGLTALGYKN